MKKVIGILGVAVIATTMLFNTNNTNDIEKGDLSIINLFSLEQAQAEGGNLLEPFGKDKVCKGNNCQDASWISFRTACSSENNYYKCRDGEWVPNF